MSARRRPLVAGNWKCNLNHLEAIALVQKLGWTLSSAELAACETVVLPPFTDLRSVQTLVDGDGLGLRYGAQDISEHEAGAFTGEVSGLMLAKLGCSYVVVGHSERRAYHGEDDATVARKAAAALRHGLVPIVCVGEELAARHAGDQVAVTLAQLDGSLAGLQPAQVATVVVAYEPLWAIGTGEVATPEDAQEMAGAVRGRIAALAGAGAAATVRVLYGGSVKGSNAAGLLAGADVDGALVGGASLDADGFAAIARATVGDPPAA